jgi:hypothetical protein
MLLFASLVTAAYADEGMWTYDNFPAAAVRQKLGVDITPAWLDRARLSTVRLANCTASFVSKDGLILTNHHCIESCLSELSSRERDLVGNGFLARSRSDELRCPTQVADVLVEMQDVTPVIAKATAGLADAAANEARKRRQTELEQECERGSKADKRTGPLKCESVTLYNGGQYFLYKYRRHTDVRVVFAPERGIAAFGGDPDNFQFPRWCLDMGILRAYENGKPVAVANPLQIRFEGPKAGEPVFVSGHPGSTDRLLTTAQLQLARDTELPPALLRGSELRGRYLQFAKTGAEAERQAQEPLNVLENTLKVRRKLLDALLEPELIASKLRAEQDLRRRVAARPDLAASIGDPWAEIETASARARALYHEYSFLEGGAGFNSRLFRYARALVRAADERAKPNAERLREYTDGALPRLEQTLTANVPIYPDIERLTLSFGQERMREWLGPDYPLVRQLLAKDSPDTLAASLVGGTRLADAGVRKALWSGGATAIAASDDPMVRLARDVDARSRAVRKRFEDEVEAPVNSASERIARARFALDGTNVYPDATFTLRLNYGTVQGWNENGRPVEPFTRLASVFERATGQPPFRVPDSWAKARASLDLDTPFNLSTNSDIVGGNSGSPLLDAGGNVVGLLFDGNIHSISGSYWFDTAKNRAIAVHPAIMREALRKVYGANELLRELGDR